MARGDLSDAEWELVEPFLPVGERGPIPDLRRQFNGAMWRFRAGSPWRDVAGFGVPDQVGDAPARAEVVALRRSGPVLTSRHWFRNPF
ncbi:transposase [Streptomyces sp. NPDC001970]